MIIKGEHYFTTTQYIRECMNKGEDIEYIIEGLNEAGISRVKAIDFINYIDSTEED
jgi:hypothetical protein